MMAFCNSSSGFFLQQCSPWCTSVHPTSLSPCTGICRPQTCYMGRLQLSKSCMSISLFGLRIGGRCVRQIAEMQSCLFFVNNKTARERAHILQAASYGKFFQKQDNVVSASRSVGMKLSHVSVLHRPGPPQHRILRLGDQVRALRHSRNLQRPCLSNRLLRTWPMLRVMSSSGLQEAKKHEHLKNSKL
jgi:hypothetical protein